VDGYNMIQALNIIAPPAAQVLLVYTTSEWSAPDPQLDIEDGIYQEPTYDEILISTLYLLSPPGTAAGSEPDATWTPYTQHNLFWNLQWAQNTNINQVPQQEVSFVIALPSGIIAQPIVNAILANVNDALDQAEAILAAHTLAGQFWTGSTRRRRMLRPTPRRTSSQRRSIRPFPIPANRSHHPY
jgi:hypothetical protein